MIRDPSSPFTEALPQPTRAMIVGNTRAATIGIVAAIIAVLPLVAVGVASLFEVNVTSPWLYKGVAVIACFFGAVAVGAAAMALNGRLTLYIGFTVGIGYTLGVVAMGAVLVIGLFAGLLSLTAWVCITLSLLAGGIALLGVYRHCVGRPAVAA